MYGQMRRQMNLQVRICLKPALKKSLAPGNQPTLQCVRGILTRGRRLLFCFCLLLSSSVLERAANIEGANWPPFAGICTNLMHLNRMVFAIPCAPCIIAIKHCRIDPHCVRGMQWMVDVHSFQMDDELLFHRMTS
jgi:hypothetical protein